jgi:hypothetical protein
MLSYMTSYCHEYFYVKNPRGKIHLYGYTHTETHRRDQFFYISDLLSLLVGVCRNLTFCKFFSVLAFFSRGPDLARGPFLSFCDKSGPLGQPPDPDFFTGPDLFLFVPDFIFPYIYSHAESILWETTI